MFQLRRKKEILKRKKEARERAEMKKIAMTSLEEGNR